MSLPSKPPIGNDLDFKDFSYIFNSELWSDTNAAASSVPDQYVHPHDFSQHPSADVTSSTQTPSRHISTFSTDSPVTFSTSTGPSSKERSSIPSSYSDVSLHQETSIDKNDSPIPSRIPGLHAVPPTPLAPIPCRRLVLFLQPSATSRFCQSIQEFQRKAANICGDHEGHQFPPHIAMTDIIEIAPNLKMKYRWQTINETIECLDINIEKMRMQMIVPQLKGIYCGSRPRPRVVLSVRVHETFRTLIRVLRRCIIDVERTESKPMNNMDLVYNSAKVLSPAILGQLKAEATNTIEIDDVLEGLVEWYIVLYEIKVLSKVLGVHHELKELRRWSIMQKHKNLKETRGKRYKHAFKNFFSHLGLAKSLPSSNTNGSPGRARLPSISSLSSVQLLQRV